MDLNRRILGSAKQVRVVCVCVCNRSALKACWLPDQKPTPGSYILVSFLFGNGWAYKYSLWPVVSRYMFGYFMDVCSVFGAPEAMQDHQKKFL